MAVTFADSFTIPKTETFKVLRSSDLTVPSVLETISINFLGLHRQSATLRLVSPGSLATPPEDALFERSPDAVTDGRGPEAVGKGGSLLLSIEALVQHFYMYGISKKPRP